MAAPKKNLLSLGHLTSTEKNTFTRQREQNLKRSVNKSVLLQADPSTLQSHHHLRTIHLQQHWQELKERELTAQQHNRQLLQQFEEAQGTLREMLTLNAAMKTIRMEYERYLEESYPRWQQQLKEKTQAAQRKKMEEYVKSCLESTEEQVTKSSARRPLVSHGSTIKPQKLAAPQKHYGHLDSNQDGSPHLHYMQSSWLTHPQSETARFPIKAPYQPQGSSYVPASFLPPPIFANPFQLHHLTSTPGHHHPWHKQNPPVQASPQPDYPWSWTTGIPSASEALWDQLYMEEHLPERGVVNEEAMRSRPLSSKRERGGGSRSSHLSQELDVKPVRLSSSPAESSESSRESSQASREKRKKKERRGRSQHTSSDRDRHSSQDSSRKPGAIVAAAVTVAQSSETDTSSEKGRSSTGQRRRSAGLSVGSPTAEKVVKERSSRNADDTGSPKDESQSTAEESGSEEAGDQNPEDKSESCREESGSQRQETSESVRLNIENVGGDVTEKGESSKSEDTSAGEKDEEEEEQGKDQGEEDEEENDDGDEKDEDKDEEERDVEHNDEVSEIKNTTEEEEETGAEEEQDSVEEQESEEHEQEKTDGLKNEDGENENQGSASSQDEEDEDERKGVGGQMEEEEKSGEEEEEEQREDKAGEPDEERDSEDSIISPQNTCKKMHIIPEESEDDAEEEEEEQSKTGSSDSDSNEFSDEDIEHLLAPQERSQEKEEKDQRAEEKPKAICNDVEIFQVEMDRSTKPDHQSDSEDFDHFYE